MCWTPQSDGGAQRADGREEAERRGSEGGSTVVCMCLCVSTCMCVSFLTIRLRWCFQESQKFFRTVRTSVYFQPGATEIFWKCWKFARSQKQMGTKQSEGHWQEAISRSGNRRRQRPAFFWVRMRRENLETSPSVGSALSFPPQQNQSDNKPTFCRVWLKSAKLMRRIS